MANTTPGIKYQNNQLGFKMSSRILDNLSSRMITAPENNIVNDDYQGDVAGNYSVYVLRNNQYDPDADVIGETRTDTWYGTDFNVENSVENMDLKYVYDKPIPIPTLLTMSLPTPTVDSYADQVGEGLARSLDRTTLGEMIGACLTFSMNDSDEGRNVIQIDGESATLGEDLAKALGEAQVKLDAGMKGKDITCPVEDRFAILSSAAYQAIIDSGINLNSNIGAQIQAFNRFYQNNIKDFNVFKAVQQILNLVKAPYVKKSDSSKKFFAVNGDVFGICGHKVATTRAVDYSVGTRIVLSSEANKQNILPLYRWGVKCMRPWFIVVLCTATMYTNFKAAVNA